MVYSVFEDLKNKLSKILKQQDDGERKNHVQLGEKTNKKPGSTSNFLTNVLIVFLVGVLLVIVGSMFKTPKNSTNKTSGATSVSSVGGDVASLNEEEIKGVSTEYKEKMEKELIATLEKIQGVGKVHAMIYFEGGAEQVPVFNQDTSQSVTSEKDTNGGEREIKTENGGSQVVMENNDNEQKPFIIKTYNPAITGVIIVAEGAGDKVTELRLRQAVAILLGLQDSKVEVYPMEK